MRERERETWIDTAWLKIRLHNTWFYLTKPQLTWNV